MATVTQIIIWVVILVIIILAYWTYLQLAPNVLSPRPRFLVCAACVRVRRVVSVHHQPGAVSAYERPITKVTCQNHAPPHHNMASGANWRQVYQTAQEGEAK